MRTPGIFLRKGRDCHHTALLRLAAQPAENGAHQQRRVETVGLRAPLLPRRKTAPGATRLDKYWASARGNSPGHWSPPGAHQKDRGTGGSRLLPASRLGPSGLPTPGLDRTGKGTGAIVTPVFLRGQWHLNQVGLSTGVKFIGFGLNQQTCWATCVE